MKSKIIVLCMVIMMSLSLSAQHVPGSWKMLNMAGEKIEGIIDTPEKVYYITGGSLYSYDKEYNETLFYESGTKLSDGNIKEMHYNVDGKYLMIIYENYNIDLIYDDGNVVNLPEIKDSNISTSKKINSVFFKSNRIYLATDFGMVIYDDQKYQVVESGFFGEIIDNVFATDDYLVINTHTGKIRISPLKDRHNTLDKFVTIADYGIKFIKEIDNTRFIYTNESNAYLFDIDAANSTANRTLILATPGCKELMEYEKGFYVYCDNGIVSFDKEGKHTGTTALTSELKSKLFGMWSGLNSVWCADNEGIANYDISSGTPTVLSDSFRPESSMLFTSGFCAPSWDGNSVYVSNIGYSAFHPAYDNETFLRKPFICERYDWATGKINSVHPYGVENLSDVVKNQVKSLNSKLFYGGNGARTIEDPIEPSIIYHANYFEGLVIFKNRELFYAYDKTNSPLYLSWGTRVTDINFDNNGNLWVGQWRETEVSSDPYQTLAAYKILPAKALEKMRKDPSSVTSADWIDTKWPISETGHGDMKTLFSSKTNKMLYIRGGWGGPIISFDTKGTTETSDDSYVVYTGMIDQDGTISNPTFKPCIVEDQKGHIWIGTSSGVFVVTDLEQLGTANKSNLSVRRPKVARNDGTNYADYLLASETVLWIAIDPSNRKWIATENSGIYLVNEDGTEILQQFTKDNSPLLSNMVYTVACDPNGNDVLIGTPQGMFVYSSTSSPASDDFSEVYVYPNPVRPDYTGWITVDGLMDNSYVKIADMQGNVFWEGQSEGGMVVWDGCNRQGHRVNTGVYLVFASQTVGDQTSGAVAKIVVVN